MVNFTKWWNHSQEEIMSQVYWLRGQLPPSEKNDYDESWNIVKEGLEKKYPIPSE